MMFESEQNAETQMRPARAGRVVLIAGLAVAGFAALFVFARVILKTSTHVSAPAVEDSVRVVVAPHAEMSAAPEPDEAVDRIAAAAPAESLERATPGARADREPPRLEVAFPPARTFDAECAIEGQAPAGSRVRVASVPVATDPDGRFRMTVALRPGPNLIIVEAADATGKTSYRSRVITLLRNGPEDVARSADSSRVANRLSMPAASVIK